VFLGIYWSNHHHLLALLDRVTGGILWANLALLLCLSFTPFVTRWAGQRSLAQAPIVMYGVVALASAFAYFALQNVIVRSQAS
jgi:uncharacterized membrane protein